MIDLSRRNLLALGGATTVSAATAAALSGCSFLSTTSSNATEGDKPKVAKGKEAPALAKKVEAGDLPAVEERLPKEPLVIETVDRVGVYGGTWRTMIDGPEDLTWLYRTVGYEPLVRWDPEFSEVIPNLAVGVEPNEDGTEYLFTLREGLKWSDGKPFTPEDVVYTQNDVDNHADLGSGQDEIVAEKVSDLEVKFVLKEPNALFLQELATGAFRITAKHYMKQFHPDYNDEIDTSDDEWLNVYEKMSTEWENSDMPTVNGWLAVKALSQEGVDCERNPYYWKVDPDGSQLPYIDKVTFPVVPAPDVMVLRASDGQVDMHVRHINTAVNKPVLAKAREKGNFDFFDAPKSNMNTMVIAFNVLSKKKGLAEVFSTKDFRIGLSHAINREEIIKAVFQRTGKPWQAAPRPEADFYHEQLATQYTEYDMDEANKRLDQAGFDKRNSKGIRLGPDNKPIAFSLMVKSEEPDMIAALDIISTSWKEAGIDMKVDAVDATLKFERELANEHSATVHTGDGGWNDAWLDPRWYFPFNAAESKFALPWALWFSRNGGEGTKPPANTELGKAALSQMDLYHQIISTTDTDEQLELMKELLDIAAETFWVIGTSLPEGGYGIVANNFHNVPETMPDSFMYPTPGPTRPEQYFIEG